MTLPNSQMVVYSQHGFHGNSKEAYPEYAELTHTDLDLDTMEPDIPVEMTYEDYVSGRDPVLEAVLVD